MQFHHVGIPTSDKKDFDTYLDDAKLHITDAEKSPFKVEWLGFEEGSPMPELLKTTPHVAFMVEDLNAEIEGKDILIEPFEPMPGLRCAFIIHDGAPIELMQNV